MKETDLAKHLVAWLEEQHWDVYQEVQFSGGIADIMAVKGGYLWVIECKTSFTLKVIEQAKNWRTHFRSVCIPKKKAAFSYDRSHGIEADLAEYFKIGIIEFDSRTAQSQWAYRNCIKEVIPAPIMKEYHEYSKKYINNLRPEHKKYSEAGSNNGGYWTPYKETMQTVKHIIKHNPGLTLKELLDKLGDNHHYMSVKVSLPSALRSFENWCEIRKDGNVNRFYIREGE